MPKRTYVKVEVDGESRRLCGEDIERLCKVELRTARARVVQYAAGKLSLNALLHVGPVPRGKGAPRKKHKTTRPTEEWKALGNTERRSTPFKAGTWERRHIRQPGVGRLSRGDVVDYDSERPSNHRPYSGQYRFAF